MAIYWILVGVILGVMVPHVHIYCRLFNFFVKCMKARDEKIMQQRRIIIILKLRLIKMAGEKGES